MGSVILFNAARMQAIEDNTVVAGLVDVDGHLILQKHDGNTVDAGLVRGTDGIDGEPGPPGEDGAEGPQGPPGPLITGIIIEWPGSVLPDGGWAWCRGQELSRIDEAALYAIIGTTYGAGNGTTTFNVPNKQGRVSVGYSSGETEFNALGKTGGAKTHQLTVTEMPSHNHGGSTGSTTLTNVRVADPGIPSTQNRLGTGNSNSRDMASWSGSNHTHSIPSQGGNGAHNNLQPFLTTNFIIKL